MDNVNNLNGVPNFGHGYEGTEEGGESDEGVQVGETALGDEEGAESAEQEAGNSNRSKRGRPSKKS